MSENIPSPAELSSIADDLEKQCNSVDDLDFLVGILLHISERNKEAKEGEYKYNYELVPENLRTLSDAFLKLAEGLEGLEADATLESIEHIREMIAIKATKAVGRA